MDKVDKQYLHLWESFAKNIHLSTPVDDSESQSDKIKRIATLEANPEEWFKYYFKTFANKPSPDFHRHATIRVVDNPEHYEVRAWSRELAKSTRTMLEVFYLTIVGHPIKRRGKVVDRKRKRNVLFISNSADNAERLLLPYKVSLENNNRIINDYGLQASEGNWEASEFVTRMGVSFRGIGAGQSPRGTRNQEIRPDVILFDDIDTDEDCRNPDTIKKRWAWIEEAAMATRSISNATTVIFCGNLIAKDCCVVRAIKYADHVDVINIRGEDGKSSWPEKNTEEHIDRVLSKISYAAAQKEYFNNPISEGTVFKELNYKPALPINKYEFLVCYTDPSYKESKKNDFKATVLVGMKGDEFHVIKAFCEQTSTSNMIDWHYQMMELVGDAVCYYYMEQVFLQDIFYQEFFSQAAIRGKQVPIVGDQRAKPDKFMRVEALLEPLNRNGKLWLNENERKSPHMQRLADQFTLFSPGSRAHDDGPDAVEGAVWMINNKRVTIATGSIKITQRKKFTDNHF
jgi:hypothetical protein